MTEEETTPGPGGRNEQYTVAEIIRALRKANGLISTAHKKTGIARNTFYRYAREYPVVQEVIDECRGDLVDRAEEQLGKQIDSGNIAAVIFTLKTIGKNRGYVERQEHTGLNGEALNVIVTHKEDKKPPVEDA